jgi:DNA-binding beta-propeller fold protein YncE
MRMNALLLALFFAAAAPHYHVVKHIPVGGDTGWDYLTIDSPSHRLFISHGDHVVVLDVETAKVVGDIPKTEGVHGIAIARDLHRGFVSNGRLNTVTIFDLDSLKVIGEAKTDERPDAILFDPVSSRVFTFNAGGKNATAIDAKSGAVTGSIPLGGKPEFAQVDGHGHLFVNVEDTGEVAEIDTAKLTVVTRWKLTGCEEPSGLAIDREHKRLFSGCGNKVMAISDAGKGAIMTTVPIGEGVDGDGFDPEYGVAFASCGGSGALTVVHEITPDKFEVIDNAATAKGARTMAVDEKTHHIFLPTAQFNPAPAPTPENPRPRRSIVPGTFEIIEVAP